MQLRDAIASDMEAVTAIYNDLVRNSAAVYNDQPVTVAERTAWWQARVHEHFPVLVAVDEHGSLAGYASFGQFRSWPGYRYTVEGTLHIREDQRRQGVGTALLEALIVRARKLGMCSMIAGVDAENQPSLAFLARNGFEERGRLPGVGYKFGRSHDLVLLQRAISAGRAYATPFQGETSSRT